MGETGVVLRALLAGASPTALAPTLLGAAVGPAVPSHPGGAGAL